MAQKLIKFLTLEEVKKLIAKAKKPELKMAIALGFGSGLRISEVVGIQKKDGQDIPALDKEQVDLETHQIRVIQGKGKKDRVTVTSPWLNKTNIQKLPLSIPKRTLQDQFSKLCERVLGKKAHFHQLRHGFGNYMVNDKNVPITQVQALMGHSRVDTTGVYARANPVQAVASAWGAFE